MAAWKETRCDKLKQIVDSATPDALALLDARDAMIDALRVTAAGIELSAVRPPPGKSAADGARR